MDAAVIAALITAAGVIGAGIVAGGVTAVSLFWRRMLRAETMNHALWVYTRLLIDHVYRGGIGPPPPPPDHIKHLYQSGDTP